MDSDAAEGQEDMAASKVPPGQSVWTYILQVKVEPDHGDKDVPSRKMPGGTSDGSSSSSATPKTEHGTDRSHADNRNVVASASNPAGLQSGAESADGPPTAFLEQVLLGYRHANIDLRTKNAELERENAQLRDGISQENSNSKQLKKENEEQRARITQLSDETEQLKKTNTLLKKENKEENKRHVQFGKETEQLKKSQMQLKKENEAQLVRITQLRSEAEQLKTSNTQLSNEVKQLKENNTQLKNENEEQNKRFAQLSNEAKQLKENNTQLKNENEEQHLRIVQLSNEAEQLKENNTQLKNENEEQNKRFAQLSNEAEQLKENNTQLKKENNELNERLPLLSKLSNETEQFKTSIMQLKKENDEQIAQSSNEIQQLIVDSTQIKKENAALKADNAKLKQELLETKLNALTNENFALRSRLDRIPSDRAASAHIGPDASATEADRTEGVERHHGQGRLREVDPQAREMEAVETGGANLSAVERGIGGSQQSTQAQSPENPNGEPQDVTARDREKVMKAADAQDLDPARLKTGAAECNRENQEDQEEMDRQVTEDPNPRSEATEVNPGVVERSGEPREGQEEAMVAAEAKNRLVPEAIAAYLGIVERSGEPREDQGMALQAADSQNRLVSEATETGPKADHDTVDRDGVQNTTANPSPGQFADELARVEAEAAGRAPEAGQTEADGGPEARAPERLVNPFRPVEPADGPRGAVEAGPHAAAAGRREAQVLNVGVAQERKNTRKRASIVKYESSSDEDSKDVSTFGAPGAASAGLEVFFQSAGKKSKSEPYSAADAYSNSVPIELRPPEPPRTLADANSSSEPFENRPPEPPRATTDVSANRVAFDLLLPAPPPPPPSADFVQSQSRPQNLTNPSQSFVGGNSMEGVSVTKKNVRDHSRRFRHYSNSPFEGSPHAWWHAPAFSPPDMAWTRCGYANCPYGANLQAKLVAHRMVAHGLQY